jgi:N utilization substance protein B
MREFYSEEEFPAEMELFFTADPENEVSEEDRLYITEKVSRIFKVRDDLDETIGECAEGWKISRLNRVDLSVLRLAVYEMVYDEEIPYRVAINEAVEIAKQFGSDESPSFINGILGKAVLLKGMQPEKED